MLVASSIAQQWSSCLDIYKVDFLETERKDREWGGSKEEREERMKKERLGKVMLTGSNLFLCSTLQFNSLKECALFTSSPTPCRASQAHLTTTPKCSCQGSWCPPYCQWHLTMYFLLLFFFFVKFFSSFGFWSNISPALSLLVTFLLIFSC